MRNYFVVKGYAVSRRGLTKGFCYEVLAENADNAHEKAIKCAENDGYSFIRITFTLNAAREVHHG